MDIIPTHYPLALAGLAFFALAYCWIRAKKRTASDDLKAGVTKSVDVKTDKQTKKKEEKKKEEETVAEKKEVAETKGEAEDEKKGGKKKKRKNESQPDSSITKTSKQLQQSYAAYFYGTLSLKASNSICSIDAIATKNSKILVSTSKNELVLYDLKRWKKDSTCQDRYFTSLDNNTASAITIGNKYYYAALTFDKTIAYYEFKGGEGKVYFKEVRKFARNIYKSDASSIYVPESESYIVTSGSEADTVINVWSLEGERLHQVNTYQIEHYDVKYGADNILVRGWTSEVKLFHLLADKTGGFSKLEKKQHLTHSEQTTCSAIDNMGLYAVTVCKNDVVKIWSLKAENGHIQEKSADAFQIGVGSPRYVAVHTLKDTNDRLKTITVIADENKVTICDRDLKVYETFEGVSVSGIHMIGSMKSIVVGTLNSSGKLTIWNITSLVEKIPEYVL